MADNVGNSTSSNSIANSLVSEKRIENTKKSPATSTVESYISALLKAFVFYEAKRYDVKGKNLLKTLGKYYIVDIGLRNVLLGYRDVDRGHILENIVFLELKRRGYNVFVGKVDEKEVDFIAEKASHNCDKTMKVKNATKQGYADAACGDSISLAFPDSTLRRGRVGHGEAHTLDTSCKQGVAFAGCGRIRRLTPRETWRLQGFSDEMFDKAAAVNSDNQLYKQAGNGVTIPVVYAVGQRIIAIQKELEKEIAT